MSENKNITIEEMHQTPGVYAVIGRSGTFFAEVDAQKVCYQLKPKTLERDGVLDREGWRVPEVLRIVGPISNKEGLLKKLSEE